ARPIPASPQKSSSLNTGIIRPVGSEKALAMKSKEYRPILAASSMIGHGVSSRSSHSSAAGRMTSSAKSWTHFWIWSWSSLRARENSAMRHLCKLPTGNYETLEGRKLSFNSLPRRTGHKQEGADDEHRTDEVRRRHGPTEQEAAQRGADRAGEAAGRLLHAERAASPFVTDAARDERRQRGRDEPLPDDEQQ